MPPKTRKTARVNRTSTVEQIERERIPRVNSPNVNENFSITPEDEALERFLKFQPPIFVGGAEQDQKAEAWLEGLEDIFNVLQYSEKRMIKFATFRLRGPARDWWIRVQEAWKQDGVEWNWNTFVLVFRTEFIPQWVVEKKEDEFQNLKQGEMTVAQYAAKFNRLSKYCPKLVDTEQNRTRQFIKGLRSELRRALVPCQLSTYSSIVDVATRIENEDKVRLGSEAIHPVKQFLMKRLAEQWYDTQQWDNKGKRTKIDATGSTVNGIICCRCKKKGHMEKDCWFKHKRRRCFHCGDSNHKKKECPKLNQFDLENTGMSNHKFEGNDGSTFKYNGNSPQTQEDASTHDEEELQNSYYHDD
jgi:hypothetical protein